MRCASVPLPDAAGPSMAMIMSDAMGSSRSVGCRERRAQPLHQRAELGKAGGDHGGVVDRDRPVGAEAERQEGHGDAVVEVGGDRAAAAYAATTCNNQGIAV